MAKRQIEVIEEVDSGEEPGTGNGLEMGVIIATTIALLVGIIVGFRELGIHYGTGPFAG